MNAPQDWDDSDQKPKERLPIESYAELYQSVLRSIDTDKVVREALMRSGYGSDTVNQIMIVVTQFLTPWLHSITEGPEISREEFVQIRNVLSDQTFLTYLYDHELTNAAPWSGQHIIELLTYDLWDFATTYPIDGIFEVRIFDEEMTALRSIEEMGEIEIREIPLEASPGAMLHVIHQWKHYEIIDQRPLH